MRFYRALLHLFPRSFRAEYGARDAKDFAREWEAARGVAMRRPVATTIVDVIANAVRVHVDILRAGRAIRRPLAAAHARLHDHRDPRRRARHRRHHRDVLDRRSRAAPAAAVPDPDRLVKIWEDHTSLGYPRMEPSPPNFRDWKRMATVVRQLEAFTGGSSESGRQRRAGTDRRRARQRRRVRHARASGRDRAHRSSRKRCQRTASGRS